MKDYDRTLLDYIFPALQRGRLRKAKRMVGVLVSRAKTIEELNEITRFIGHEFARHTAWTMNRWRNFKKPAGDV